MFTENQLLPISALQHLFFCERQCALIHVERLWAENQWTVEGNQFHRKAHGEQGTLGKPYIENGFHIVRGLSLRSLQLGLIGQADIVEFDGDLIRPVEYKRGKPKKDDCDRVQVCAQALCLEEMFDRDIKTGFLFYGKRKRRIDVHFNNELRQKTRQTIGRLRQLIDNRETPRAVRATKCDSCSLERLCLPDAMRLKSGASQYLTRHLQVSLSSEGPTTDDFESGQI